MANHKSSKARIIRNAKVSKINSARRNMIRTFVKKVELAVAAGDVQAAKQAFIEAQPHMQRGVAKGVMNKKAVSRKMSRLTSSIKKIEKAA